MITWFCEWRSSGSNRIDIPDADIRGMSTLIRDCQSVESAVILRPITASDPHYLDQSQASSLAVQINFADTRSLEAALSRSGPLAALCEPILFPNLQDLHPSQEIMVQRRYPVLAPTNSAPEQEVAYLVTYEGPARDEIAWHTAYLHRHPVLLCKLVGIRELEIFTPAIAVSELPIPLIRSLQRNKTVFASAELMREAMLSDVRKELRADFNTLPPFEGEARHEPHSVTRAV